MAKKNVSFFNQFFTKKRKEDLNINLGKYSDRNKTLKQLKYWSECIDLYDEKKYIESAEKFFLFVKSPKIENLSFIKKESKIVFEFYQGSKKINGFYTKKQIYVSSDIVKTKNNNAKLAKKLLNINYELKFCHFSAKKNTIICELNLITSHTNPITLYYALRELAISADRYDDIISIDFKEVTPVNISHIIPLKKNELLTKIKYFRSWSEELFDYLKSLEPAKFIGARAFMMMSYIFRIFYLLSPEGKMLEKIKNIYKKFYTGKKLEIERNAEVFNEIKKLSNLTDEEIKDSLYFVYSTFPVVPPTQPIVLQEFVKKEIDKIHWYEDNNYKKTAIAVTDYIIGYAYYNFGNEAVIDELFQIYWEVINSDFFNDLNIPNVPVEKNRISYFVLNQRFNSINLAAKKEYPKFYFNLKHLNLSSKQEFAKSFIYEILNLNFKKS